MQKVTLTLEDTEDMQLTVQWKCEPPVDMEQPCTSSAVYTAMKIMEFVQELIQKAAQQNRDIQLGGDHDTTRA
jgi:hypothetical protein